MRKPLECGNYWNADRTHGAAQPFDVGMRMQLYGVAWPLEIGMRMQLYGRLIHLTLECGRSCRRPPSFWNADETHGAAHPFDVQIAAVECQVARKMCRRPEMRSISGSRVGSIGFPSHPVSYKESHGVALPHLCLKVSLGQSLHRVTPDIRLLQSSHWTPTLRPFIQLKRHQ
ncbi:hypothetical protein QAD02_005875 [Eretmocerus hayati]|uniref:Uncharacterized protein n=1 Tax=Eretmocerus hayati TaxID=131215 RepID=A0ACC2NUT1_9HYME|nr:hypothetical protein QAD02_005875 [Eretmocerus hayati]